MGVLVLGMLYASFVYVQKTKRNEAGKEIAYMDLQVVFLVEEVENNVSDYIFPGEIVVDHENGLEFGKIKEHFLTSHRETVIYGDEPVSVSFPDKSDLYLTIEARATDLNDSYVVAAKKLAIGKKIALYSKDYACYGTIIGIEETYND